MNSGLPQFIICILRNSRRKSKLYFSWQDITKTARRGIPIAHSAHCLMSSFLKSSNWMQGLMVNQDLFFPFLDWSKLPFFKKDWAVYFLEMMPVCQRSEACRMKWLRLREASATLCVSVVSSADQSPSTPFTRSDSFHSFAYVLGTGELRSTSSSGYESVPSQLGALAGLKIKHIYCGYYYTIAVV